MSTFGFGNSFISLKVENSLGRLFLEIFWGEFLGKPRHLLEKDPINCYFKFFFIVKDNILFSKIELLEVPNLNMNLINNFYI